METIASLVLGLIRDLTGYWILRLLGRQKPGEIAMTFTGAAFWVLLFLSLLSFAPR